MKRLPYILLSIFLALSLIAGAAERVDNIQIRYSASDFELKTESDGSVSISAKGMATYPDGNEPGLPYFATSIAVSAGYSFESLKPLYTTTLVRSGIEISQTPVPVPTDGSVEYQWPLPITYSERTYPESVVEYTSSLDWSEVSVLNFVSSPFIYDAKTKELYFVDAINVEVRSTNDTPSQGRGRCLGKEYVKSIVSNSDAVESIMRQSHGPAMKGEMVNPLDYLIVTSAALKPAFEDLLLWKKTKGLHAEIITVEEIYAEYKGDDEQEKIKNCLYNLHLNRGLKYVMLGGDDTVVPVRYCMSTVYFNRDLPTDMYYACFGGDFTWDLNKNGIYGETTDNINVSPSVFLTRLPVRTKSDISNFSSKLISYEKNPRLDKSIFMAGKELDENELGHVSKSNGEEFADSLYSGYIKPYWDGKYYKLFDTYSDFGYPYNDRYRPQHLQECLSNGYGFIELITHGGQKAIETETIDAIDYYTTAYATELNNKGYSIITTMSCLSNAFDTHDDDLFNPANEGKVYRCLDDPCLSEAFIRNKDTGILAYIGCSREGWYDSWGPSMTYEASFYSNLFNSSHESISLGELITKQKLELQNKLFDKYMRWVHYALNTMGDPEMPIYTDQPMVFNSLVLSAENEFLNIDTGEEDCTIEIRDCMDDNKNVLTEENARTVSLSNLPATFILKISKEGFAPKYLRVCFVPKGELSGIVSDDKFDVAFIGTCCRSNEPLVRISGNNKIKAEQFDFWPDIEITDDAVLEIE